MKTSDFQAEAGTDNLKETPILNYHHLIVQNAIAQIQLAESSEQIYVQSAHSYIKRNVRPVYTVDEFQPVSETLQKQKGSCSQRMACLEAFSRSNAIATRVRGLWIDGRFWYPRFRFSRPFIPHKILLALPQFHIAKQWIDFDELFGNTTEMAGRAETGFSNSDETLFEAVEHTAVDFFGKTRDCGTICSTDKYDLSKYVVKDEGYFDTRDVLFQRFGSFQYSWRGRGFEMIFGGRKSA